MKPLFITFEGGEGAGKTTLINRLAGTLQNRGYAVVKTREPGGSKLSETIRNLLLNHDAEIKISTMAELLLFLAARAQHLEEVIKPALKSGTMVLCDRFNDSTVAYQGYARGLGMAEVETLCKLVCQDVMPDMTLFLDIDPEVGLDRSRFSAKENAASGHVDRIESEKMSFHDRVRQGFLQIAKQNPGRFHTLDASLPADTVFEEAVKLVDARLGIV